MKYWYFKFTYENETVEQGIECETVIRSEKEHFPLVEAKDKADELIKKDPSILSETDFNNDEITIMIDNQFQINEEDFDAFHEELEKE